MEREAATRLEEADQLKNTLLDVVSHDLRSPLAAIRAITSVLHRDAKSPTLSAEQRQAYLTDLAASANRMRNLLDNLLDLERLATGDITLRNDIVDLAEVTRSVVSENAAELAGRDVRLDLEPVTALVDGSKVERVIENLLANAARHTPDGTAVSVSVRRDGEAALICVEDAGPGVPLELRETIFERFQQAPGADPAGVGMGLSLVARLARLHGGQAWVEESPIGGASFRVKLPIAVTTLEEQRGRG